MSVTLAELMRWFVLTLLSCFLVPAWAEVLTFTPPPPLQTAGGEALFLLFSLDAPGADTVRLAARFPDGFRLLSAAERDVVPGDNLFPVSVAVAASVPAGRYDLCLGVEGSLSEACAEVRVTARAGLLVGVPSELFGDTLPVTLSNEGNRAQTLELRALELTQFSG